MPGFDRIHANRVIRHDIDSWLESDWNCRESETVTSIMKVISGGQTGVDRAALDVALELGIDCGGWCPYGRKAEDGRVPERYPLRETATASYAVRTRWNVRDADATLILTRGIPSGGTALTIALARRLEKPLLVQRLQDNQDAQAAHILSWLREHHVHTLNVAGPRESHFPGIYQAARQLLHVVCAASRENFTSRKVHTL